MLGNTRFISRVKHDITFNTRNESGIYVHPCIILYLNRVTLVLCYRYNIVWLYSYTHHFTSEGNLSGSEYVVRPTIVINYRNTQNLELCFIVSGSKKPIPFTPTRTTLFRDIFYSLRHVTLVKRKDFHHMLRLLIRIRFQTPSTLSLLQIYSFEL